MTTHLYECQGCETTQTIADAGIRTKRSCSNCEDTTTWERQVWVSYSGADSGKKYHTEEDCFQLPDGYRRKSLSLIEPTFEECRFCSGKAKKPTPDYSYQEALKKAAEGD